MVNSKDPVNGCEVLNSGKNLYKVIWYYGYLANDSDIQKIVCPFHDDINPSMTINFIVGSFYCFGCGASGNAFDFVKLVNPGLSEMQALLLYVKILASDKCSKVDDRKFVTKRQKNATGNTYAIAYDYYKGLLSVNWLNPNNADEQEVFNYMSKRGVTAAALNAVNAKVTYNKHYNLIFPMLDNGKFKGWVSRTMIKEIEEKRKYLYNKGFRRASTLVGDYGKYKYIIVVEGYMDRLKFLQYGVNNVVAILGWKMTANQIEKLKAKGITHIISALDNDKYGRKGTVYLKDYFKVIPFNYIKGVKDPGEMNQKQFIKCYNKTLNNAKEILK